MPDTVLTAVAEAICSDSGFRFSGWVGEGAFKETFRVLDRDRKTFALKIFRSTGISPRAEREVNTITRCSHPNIATLIRAGTKSLGGLSYPFVLEEFLHGGTLGQRLVGSQMDPGQVHEIGRHLIDAVGYLASLRLVHRDIKPENVMFRDSGRIPVLVDFGIVRDLNDQSLTHTWLMRGPGTPLYASPEQLNNQKDMIDWRTDQFSLGVTLTHAAFGIHPYAQPGTDTVENTALRKPRGEDFVAKTIAANLSPLIRMVAPYPVDRYRRPALLGEAWRSCLGSHP